MYAKQYPNMSEEKAVVCKNACNPQRYIGKNKEAADEKILANWIYYDLGLCGRKSYRKKDEEWNSVEKWNSRKCQHMFLLSHCLLQQHNGLKCTSKSTINCHEMKAEALGMAFTVS